MDLRRLSAIGKRWLPLLVTSALLAAATGFFASNLQPKVYEARATLIVGQSQAGLGADYTQLLASQRLSTTYASIATHRPRLAAVISELNLDVSPEELAKRVVAEAPVDSTLVTITAQAPDADEAAGIANALSAELITASQGIQGSETDFQSSIESDLRATQAQVKSAQTQIEILAAVEDPTAEQVAELAALEARLVTLRSTYASMLSFVTGNATSLLTVSEPAVPPNEVIAPRPLLNTLLALVLGLAIAVGIIGITEYFRDSMGDPEYIRTGTGLNTLGTIPRMKGGGNRKEIYQLAALLYPRSGTAEAYRTLVTNIEFASADAPLRTLLVVSALPAEGKTVTASNVAVVFAQAGRRVLLVDADLRRPGIHRMFGLPNSHGLTDLLLPAGGRLESVLHVTEVPNLKVLTAGPLPPNPRELLASQRMRELLMGLAADFDIVVFDSPPTQAVADAAVLSSVVDGSLLVIDATRSRRRSTTEAARTLNHAGARVLGAVLNRGQNGSQGEYKGYYSEMPTAAPPTTNVTSPTTSGSGTR